MSDRMDLEGQWRERVARVLKGASFDEVLVSHSADGLRIEPLYPPAEEGARAFRQRPERPWRIVQRVDHPVAAVATDLALADLEGGADALSVTFAGAPGAFGYGLAAPADLGAALAGVEPDLIALTLDHAPFAAEAGVDALLAVMGDRRLTPDRLAIGFGIDPVSDAAFAGRAEPEATATAAALAARLREAGFETGLMRADGAVHHEAGATEAEELAATLASALICLRALEAAGLPLDAASAAIDFRLGADQDEFLTIAKFRALRRLWAGIETACGLTPRPIRIEARSSRRMMTATDGETNLLRLTLAGFSAAIGGADAIALLPHSGAAGLPDAFARRLARNMQHVLVDECRLAAVGDPAAGAGAFEALTAGLCERAYAILQETERAGGILAMLADGTWQARLEASRRRRADDIAAGRRTILGVTLFPPKTERPAAVFADVSPSVWVPTTETRLAGTRDEDLIATEAAA